MKSGIQTHTGKAFFFSHRSRKDPKGICIEDIAHSLALCNRFFGHTRVPYSVAEHSVRMSWREEMADPLTLLLHDCAEAYLGDVARPLKSLSSIMFARDNGTYIGIWRRRAYEDIVTEQIIKTLGVKVDDFCGVKECDTRMLVTEFRDLFDHPMRPDLWGSNHRFTKPFTGVILPWTWHHAEEKFLARYKELTK